MRNKPRIGIVIGQLSHGGAERQVSLLATGLLRTGEFEPFVFCISRFTHPYGRVLSEEGVQWFVVPEGTQAWLGKLLWLLKHLQNTKCDLVYGILHVGNIYGGAAAMINRLPFVGSIRNTEDRLPILIKHFSRFFCDRASQVIANSKSSLESLRHELRICHDRVRVIPNAVRNLDVHEGRYQSPRDEWSIPDDAILVGTIGLLKSQKRPDFFIDIFLHIQNTRFYNSNSPFHFVWVGDGVMRDFVEQRRSMLPSAMADRLHFPGSREDIPICLDAFNVFVLTSAYEGMPNVLLEAMRAGLPCIATNVNGTRDVWHQLSGYPEIGVLADPDSPWEFSKTLLDVLNNPVRMQKMGKNAQKFVEINYSTNKMIKEHSRVFHHVIDLRRFNER